jgi:Ca2+-binding EF-hand superfamily protein
MAQVVRGRIEAPSKVGSTVVTGAPVERVVGRRAVPDIEHDLTEDELDDIQQAFNLFDLNDTGVIKTRQVKLALDSLGPDHRPSVFRLLDGIEELPDEIEYSEFLGHIVERLGNKKSRPGVEHIFKLFDHDNAGVIDLPKFKRVTKELGEAVPDDQLEVALARNTSSGQPQVTPEDFYVVMTKRFYA